MKTLRISVLFLMVSFSASTIHAGTWAKTYGGINAGGYPFSVKTVDGGYVFVDGATLTPGDPDLWVVKLDPEGTVQWQKAYLRGFVERVRGIAQTVDGGYVITGELNGTNGFDVDIFVLKIDPQGDILWQKTFGQIFGDFPFGIDRTADGGCIIAGVTSPASSEFGGHGPSFLIKLDADGNVQWQKIYGGSSGGVFFRTVQQTSDGGYIVTGNQNPEADALVIKLDGNGTVHWQRIYHPVSQGVTQIFALRLTSDRGYVVAGSADDLSTQTSSPLSGGLAMKLDSNGNILWQKVLGTNRIRSDVLRDVRECPDGGYILSGNIVMPFNILSFPADDAWLLKLDKDGNLLWQKTYGGDFDESFNNVHPTDGGYIAIGDTRSFGGGYADVFSVKVDVNGEVPGWSGIRPSPAVPVNISLISSVATLSASDGSLTSREPGFVPSETNMPISHVFIEGIMPLPLGGNAYGYNTFISPSLDTNPQVAKPLALGYITESPDSAPLSIRVGMLPFAGPIDVYLAVHAPAINPELWLITKDNALKPLSAGLAKWKEAVTGRIEESIVEYLDTTILPGGTYTFYLAVTPAGSLSDYYLWWTSFTKQ